jgi:hypothetical protein
MSNVYYLNFGSSFDYLLSYYLITGLFFYVCAVLLFVFQILSSLFNATCSICLNVLSVQVSTDFYALYYQSFHEKCHFLKLDNQKLEQIYIYKH